MELVNALSDICKGKVTLISAEENMLTGPVARMEESRSFFKILTDKPIGRRPLGMPTRRWERNYCTSHGK